MKAILEGWRELAPEVRHFDFVVPEVTELPFLPGQFVSMSAEMDGRKITRAYSISSAPDGNRFALCLNRVPDGRFSPYLFALGEGDGVEFKGPLGAFTLRDSPRERIFVATGTGIAPFRSMIAWEAERGLRRATKLFFGTRYRQTLLYREDLEAWAADGLIDFQPVLSREDSSGLRGHVQEHVMAAIGGRLDFDVYICGLQAMVDDLRTRLKAVGFPRQQLICEKFD